MLRAPMAEVEKVMAAMLTQKIPAYERATPRGLGWLRAADQRDGLGLDAALPAAFLTEVYRMVRAEQACGAVVVGQLCNQCAQV